MGEIRGLGVLQKTGNIYLFTRIVFVTILILQQDIMVRHFDDNFEMNDKPTIAFEKLLRAEFQLIIF